MNWTTAAAWVGAGTGLCSLVWNIYLELSAGPKVSVYAQAGMVQMPPTPGNPRFLRIIVRNNGTAATTITNYVLLKFDSLKSRFRKTELTASYTGILTSYQGPPCPVKLGVGDEINVIMKEDRGFQELANSGRLWIGAFHSFSKKPVLAKIILTGETREKAETAQAGK